jgi:dipeptidyl aminopeptidase/acylaminoacyl peptidase
VPPEADQLLVERYSRAGKRSFYTMDLDGSSVAPFPGVPADALALVPYPSPDGRTIAYLRRTPEDSVQLWLMDREGTGRRPLYEGQRVVEHAAWSPDGSRLAVEQSTGLVV